MWIFREAKPPLFFFFPLLYKRRGTEGEDFIKISSPSPVKPRQERGTKGVR